MKRAYSKMWMAVAAVLASAASPALAQSASTYFPLRDGNLWSLSPGEESKEVYVDYDRGSLHHVHGLFDPGTGVWMATSTSSPTNLFAWNAIARRWTTLIRFGAALKTAWTVDLGGACARYSAQVKSRGEALRTPAGTFLGVTRISFTLTPPPNVRCAMPQLNEIAFAPSVGPVQYKSPDGRTFQLEYAEVNGTEYPAPATATVSANGLTVTLTLDQSRYVSFKNTIRCITTPCPSNGETAVAGASLTVHNDSRAAKTFSFASGQQFDFRVIDASGRERLAWSDGKYFTMALTAITLAPGESRTFEGSLKLDDRNGLQLDGRLTVTGYLTTARWSTTTAPAVKVPIEVVVVPGA